LDDNYAEKWEAKTRSPRKKFLAYQSGGEVSIEMTDDVNIFLEYYRATKTKNPYKNMVERMTQKLFTNTKNTVRIYFGKIRGEIVAGAIFLDCGTTSEYFASFFRETARPYQFGVGMMDRGFSESRARGIRYCDFDHMRDA
jgi:hypothetical protein